MIAIARSLFTALLICGWFFIEQPAARADFAVTFTVDTIGLETIANNTTLNDPFALQFSFFLGGSSTDTATISNFNFGVGSPGGNAWTTYGMPVQGDLSSSIVMTPDNTTYFGQVFQQDFNPGSLLTFTVDFSTPLNDGDQFSVQFLTAPTGANDPSDYTAIQTVDPSYQNNFITVSTYTDLSPSINVYASADPNYPVDTPQYMLPIAISAPASIYLFIASLPILVSISIRKWVLKRALNFV